MSRHTPQAHDGDGHLEISADADALPFTGIASLAGRAVQYGEFRPVCDLIEAQAARSPERPAACHAGRTLTYQQLDQLANGIAIAAACRGVAKGDRVATLLSSGLEMPAAYLALMKLGAVFVPMDPGWPGERLQVTLRILSPRLILCAAADQVPAEFRGASMPVAVAGISPSSERPEVPLEPGDLCYGFFTSGTTGTPKCALNRHGGLANRLQFMTRYFAATGDDVVLQNSKHTFDSSLWQLLWPLITGGQAVLPAAGEFLNLRQTIDTIAEHKVTSTDFVSSIFNILVAMVDGDDLALRKLSSLRYLIVGSEEINARAVHRMRALLPRLRITNGYGPTETTIGMVFHSVSDADGDVIPLGRPIDNCYVAVLGADRAVLPRGTIGEIAIGGACVGAGYHGDQVTTQKAFVPNSVPEHIPGDRLYLSGDFGYLDERGRLFFSGRKDFQVKIGGVRIELGEVEAAAQTCPGVHQAKVLVAERDGTRSLALFAAGDDRLTEARLRHHVRQILPRTSVPRYCTVLAQMPLGEVGKVDWRALQAMLDRRLDSDAAGLTAAAPPGSWPELTLRAFRVALGQPGLGADQDFMSVGGDSIRALIAVRMLADDCGVPDLCVQDLVEHPTASGLAELISTREPSAAAAEAEAAQMERDVALAGHAVIRAVDGTGSAGQLRTVLVTGPTGFVGSRLVHDLLARTDLRVAGLARAASDAEAAQRVASSLASRGLWQPGFADRLDGYAGDLAQPGLGLADATWDHLARTCDLVLHNGALVNFLFGYAAHRAPNVTGTAELLRLAMSGRPVPMHYISTLSALQAQAQAMQDQAMQAQTQAMRAQAMRAQAVRAQARQSRTRLPEVDCPSATAPPARGYSRSKWVAERYLAQARRQGALITVLRLGEVLPSQQNPHPNTRALTHLLLSAIHRLGSYPDAAIRSDYTPVDYAAARVVSAVTDRAAWGATLHVLHPESTCFGRALAIAGAPVAETSCTEFLARLREAADRTGDRDLAGLAALLPAPSGRDEPALRRALGALLTDNPSLYRKDECGRLEERWQLTDPDLRGPITAYRAYLDRARQSEHTEQAVPALAPASPATGGS
jgi:amino acid adenylation domain-containing protein/thioester reductase-like protein